MENNGKQSLLLMLTSSCRNVNHYYCIDISGDEVIYTICVHLAVWKYIFLTRTDDTSRHTKQMKFQL